ncbi:MAG TPA: AAA family ATPase [Lapillicoccus sp.]|uniref:AAA family ATPase n=1 Tax=Lapillicoccus sp. TaxID=1909287 RepID=UPI002F925F15
MTTLHVVVGLPGAGKTTLAKRLEAELPALRLTPDEWMVPLFGESEAGGKRNAVEGLLIGVAMRSLRLGVDVVLDFGVWSRDERTGLRHLAADVGSVTRLHYLSVEPEEQWRRLAARDDPRSFRIARAEMDGYATLFETPTVEELAGHDDRPDDPDWTEWSRGRWHTLAE